MFDVQPVACGASASSDSMAAFPMSKRTLSLRSTLLDAIVIVV